jgi:hypothetical protein
MKNMLAVLFNQPTKQPLGAAPNFTTRLKNTGAQGN